MVMVRFCLSTVRPVVASSAASAGRASSIQTKVSQVLPIMPSLPTLPLAALHGAAVLSRKRQGGQILLLAYANHRGRLADVGAFQVAGGDVQAAAVQNRAAVDHARSTYLG